VRAPCVYLAFQRGSFGYIVMEYIDGKMCDNSDADLVAAAVQSLIEIKNPSSEPGPIGGGLIQHPFFVDQIASRRYSTFKQLEDHINRASVLICPLAAFLMITLDTDPS
jgi:hypothetical protein